MSKRSFGWVVSMTCGFLVATFVVASLASAAEPRRQIEQLFELGAKASPSVLALADEVSQRYDELQAQSIHSPRLDYAYALVLTKLGKYDPALEQLTKLANGPDEALALDARRVRVWLLVIKKRPQEALAEMASLSGRIWDGPTTEKNAEVRLDAAHYFGALFGFLQGPSENDRNIDLDRQKRRLVARMDKASVTAFDESVAGINESFDDLKDRHEIAATRALNEQEERLEEEKSRTKELLANVEKQKKDLESTAERELAKYDAAQKDLQQRWQSAASSFAALEGQINALEWGNANSYWQLQSLQNWFGNRRRASYGQSLATDLATQQLGNNIIGNSIQAGSLRAQQQSLNVIGDVLTAQANQVWLMQQNTWMVLAKTGNDLQRKARQLEAKDAKLAHLHATNTSSETQTLKLKIHALKTYVEFPFEQEKERLLESLAERR